MAHISDIKLIRTDTTLDLSQKAEKGMPISFTGLCFYTQLFSILFSSPSDVGYKSAFQVVNLHFFGHRVYAML